MRSVLGWFAVLLNGGCGPDDPYGENPEAPRSAEAARRGTAERRTSSGEHASTADHVELLQAERDALDP